MAYCGPLLHMCLQVYGINLFVMYMRWQDKRLCALPILADKLQPGSEMEWEGRIYGLAGKIKDGFHLWCSWWSEISCLFPYPPER